MIRLVSAGAFALVLFTPLTVLATAQRTFVASNGNDAASCTVAQPCRSFSLAVGKTSANGEVIVLDSAGYGPVYLTQSVSIIAPAGIYAGVTVISGIGITVDGSGIKVLLRGLSINGQGGSDGIRLVQGAALTVENCEITNMNIYGISVTSINSQVTVHSSVLRNNFTGIVAVASSGTTLVTVGDSLIAANVNGVVSTATGGGVGFAVTRSILTGNSGDAFQVNASPGASASILTDGNTVTYSSIGFHFIGGGGSEVVHTRGNNTVGYTNSPLFNGVLTPCCSM